MDRKAIIGADSKPTPRKITIEEWGGDFLLMPLSGYQAEEIILLAEQAKTTGDYLCLRGLRGRAVTWAVAGLDEQLLFVLADAAELTTRWPKVISRLFEEIKVMNGLTEESRQALNKDAAKNSETVNA